MITEEELKKIIDGKYEYESKLFSELSKHGVAFRSKYFSEEMDSLLENIKDTSIYWGGGEDGDIVIAKTTVPGLLVVRGDNMENPFYIPTTKEAKIVINQFKIAFGELEKILKRHGAKNQ